MLHQVTCSNRARHRARSEHKHTGQQPGFSLPVTSEGVHMATFLPKLPCTMQSTALHHLWSQPHVSLGAGGGGEPGLFSISQSPEKSDSGLSQKEAFFKYLLSQEGNGDTVSGQNKPSPLYKANCLLIRNQMQGVSFRTSFSPQHHPSANSNTKKSQSIK